MKIAFFGLQSAFDYSHIGGSESTTRRLARQLTESCDVEEVDYVLFGAPRTEAQVVMPRVRVRYFQTYAEALHTLPTDYDHIVSLHLPIRERVSYTAFRAQYRHRLTFHAFRTMNNPSATKRLLGSADLRLVPLNGALFVISPRLYHMVRRWVRRSFLMLPPVPDDWFLRAEDKANHFPIRVSFIGRIDPGKGAAEASELFYRLKDDRRFLCRFFGYTFESGRVTSTEADIYRRLKALPAGTFVESSYTSYSPQGDRAVRDALAETDILLLPYRNVSSTADMPLVFMEGMASLCALVIPESAADLPQVYGPSQFCIRGTDWVENMLEIVRSAEARLDAERQSSEARNAQLNFGLAATAAAFKGALLGQEPPHGGDWPENLLTFRGAALARQ